MNLVGKLMVLLGADVGSFESDMGKAVRVAEQKTKQIERHARTTGRAMGDIGQVLNTVNFGGLDKISESSRVASAAVKGLGGALTLIGTASWPVVAIGAAATAVATFGTSSGKAEKEAEELGARMDKLALSAKQLALIPLQEDLLKNSKERLRIEEQLADVQGRRGLMRNWSDEAISDRTEQLEQDLATWIRREKLAYDQILKVRENFASEAQAISKAAVETPGVSTMDRMVVKPNAALQAELDNIKLAKKLAEEAKTPFEELGAALAVIDQALTARDIEGNPLLSAEAAEHLKAVRLDEYYKAIAKSASEMGPPLLEAGVVVTEGTDKWAEFGTQAGDSINRMVVGLQNGTQASENFFGNILKGLANTAQALATSALLEALFGGWSGKSGFMGAFAAAVIPGKAGGGGVGPYSLHEVNEHRPEMLSMGDRDYLLMGAKGGRVDPNPGGGGATTLHITNNVNVAQGLNSAQAYQGVTRALAEFRRGFVRDLSRGNLVPVS